MPFFVWKKRGDTTTQTAQKQQYFTVAGELLKMAL
jgi:hypothetical protein